MWILRLIPWNIAVLFLAAFGVSFVELERTRSRVEELSHHQFHDHRDVRQFIIRAALSEADDPIVTFGDSITEMAPLPRRICGHPVVNAGIGGIDIWEAAKIAPPLLADSKPFLVAIALGANDIGSSSIDKNYSDLIKIVRRISPRLLTISDSSDEKTNKEIRNTALDAGLIYIEPEIAPSSKMADGIHYTGAAYHVWISALEAAIAKKCE